MRKIMKEGVDLSFLFAELDPAFVVLWSTDLFTGHDL